MFVAAQVIVLLAAGSVVTWAHGWAGVGHFFTGLTAAGLTGLLAVLAVALPACPQPPAETRWSLLQSLLAPPAGPGRLPA